jgi:hypothetical protein
VPPESRRRFKAALRSVVFAELERDFIRSHARGRWPCDGTTVSSSADRGRRQTTWWPARVVRQGTKGKPAYAIAPDLNKDAVPTAQGAPACLQATVRAPLMRESK